MNDDELTAHLRAARPQTPRRGQTLDARQESLLTQIIAEPVAMGGAGGSVRKGPARQARPVFLAAASVMLVLVLGALGSIALFPPSAAVAATPKLLSPEPIAGTAEENLMTISGALRDAGSTAGGPIRIHTWALAFDGDAATPPRYIVPEEHEIDYLPDGSVSITVRAGVPYDPDGDPVADPSPAPGTVLWSLVQEPADVVLIFEPAPTEVSQIDEFFDKSGVVPSRTSGEYFSAIPRLLSEQALSREQEAALIGFLATLPDISVDGAVTDRLGREGVAFSTESRTPGDYRDTLVLSASAGILSYEVTYIGSSRTDIQAPAIIEYLAWE